MDRRQFIHRSIIAGGAAAFGGVVLPGQAAALAQGSKAPARSLAGSISPCSYSLHQLVQDATGTTAIPTGVEVHQGLKYRIKLCWQPMAGAGVGWLEFRHVDGGNYYQLKFRPDSVTLGIVLDASGFGVAGAARPIDFDHPAMFTLKMNGTHFTVTDDAVTGSPVIMDWKDPNNSFPTGRSIAHYTGNDTKGCWEDAVGTALSLT